MPDRNHLLDIGSGVFGLGTSEQAGEIWLTALVGERGHISLCCKLTERRGIDCVGSSSEGSRRCRIRWDFNSRNGSDVVSVNCPTSSLATALVRAICLEILALCVHMR